MWIPSHIRHIVGRAAAAEQPDEADAGAGTVPATNHVCALIAPLYAASTTAGYYGPAPRRTPDVPRPHGREDRSRPIEPKTQGGG